MTESVRAPGVERRRQLRLQRRQEQLRNLWRLVVLLALSGGLGYALLRQGWSLRGPSQVEVVGSRQVSRDQVVEAAGLSFPQPLLGLEPRRLSARLTATLPVEQVQVKRLMAPPRLRVELVDRRAVARAERQSARGLENGYVDRLGHWMSSRQGQNLASHLDSTLLVRGWSPRQRPSLALILNARQRLGNDLQEILLNPDGTLVLRTGRLGAVNLGPGDQQLPRRLEVLAHLQQDLPGAIRGRKIQAVDLSDPGQPELTLPGKAPKTPSP